MYNSKEYHKKYYQDHKKKIGNMVKANYKKNKEKRLLYQKLYYQNNKEEVLQRCCEYYNKNKKSIRERHKKRLNSPEGKQWLKEYRQRPHVKKKNADYAILYKQRPGVKEKMKKNMEAYQGRIKNENTYK